MDTDLNSVNSTFLSHCDDHKLFQLTRFYRDRLEQAIEEGVDGLGLMLMGADHFSGLEYHSVTDLAEKGNRAASSKFLVDLVMEKGSGAQRVMWESFVKTRHTLPKLDRILKDIQERGDGHFAYMDTERCLSQVPTHLKDLQKKHKETHRTRTEKLSVNTILMKEKVKDFQLVDRYAALTVISTVRDRSLVEHELLARGRDHEKCIVKCLRRDLEKIRIDQLFQSCFFHNVTYWGQFMRFFGYESRSLASATRENFGSFTVVAGVPGIGKTTMVQKIVYDWATGKIYQHFQFVFSFRFRDLNTINCQITLKELILDQYPYFGNILGAIWKNPEGLLFIFDGFDEFKDMIDFDDSQRHTEPQHMCPDPEFRCKVPDIVYSLIQQILLPGCSVLVTTRPNALHLLEKAKVSMCAEILGFVGEQRKEYFTRHFEDQTVAGAVFKHVEENVILYTMSYNPSYCSILGLTLGPFFTKGHKDPNRVPKTITQLYSYYIYNILQNHGRETESPREVLLRLGQMAFTGVSEKKIVFTDGDLDKYNLKPSQFLSGFLMELLDRDDSVQNVVYTFPHLTIQEFVAALAQFLCPYSEDLRRLLTESHSTTDGRFEIFLRFVAGLSYSLSARSLEEFLGPFPYETTCQVIDWVKEEVERQAGNTECEAGKRSLLNTMHYLFESHNSGLAQNALGSVETLSFSGLRLTPIDCSVLSHVIGCCDTIKHLDLDSCHIQCEGLQRLGPRLHKCQHLGLGNNDLGDSTMKLVSDALRDPNCKIQRLGLGNNGLTASPIAKFTTALSANRSLMELDIKDNKLGDLGVNRLSESLKNVENKIQKLELKNNSFTASCMKKLGSALSGSLIELGLDNNKLGDSGVKLLCAALRNTDCKIQTLRLCSIGLTASGAQDLVSALSTNCSLINVSLSSNTLGTSGVKLVSEALKNPDCKIQKLHLWDVGLTESCSEDLASALFTNCSLKVLSLGDNQLGDLGVKRFSVALGNQQCKLQELELYKNGLTDSCTEDLSSCLRKMHSLKVVDLGANSFTDVSVPSLRHLIEKRKNLKQIVLQGNPISSDGQNQLKSLRGLRKGLKIEL
ncbi:NACHT, LRR and PYD domains-containing protein 3-like [Leucoraja erinacea]|uniref:NACHT, LRR and PYD domains-containing protein 3-like n=1 Tax=Leucoraja erinaceus TaxID=7782 RepID=UPI0024565755|nr:NACHT, LRR and PYD domains-containing protein 3-like [Leucoraja erinacea]